MRRWDSDGQATVEVMLILPIFFGIVFVIMEIGHLAFRTILLNHAAYEAARIGSLTTLPLGVPCPPPPNQTDDNKIKSVVTQIIPDSNVNVSASLEKTGTDPQSQCPNMDIIVKVDDPVPLIFPGMRLLLGNGANLGTGTGTGVRIITAVVRMPVERPLFK